MYLNMPPLSDNCVSPAVILDMSYNITDVRDVAMAQILAMEHDAVQGRHCFANEAVHLSTVLQIIHEAFHDMELPTRKVSGCLILASPLQC
jgi:nucleoside-diphosphate-sugar epimerase